VRAIDTGAIGANNIALPEALKESTGAANQLKKLSSRGWAQVFDDELDHLVHDPRRQALRRHSPVANQQRVVKLLPHACDSNQSMLPNALSSDLRLDAAPPSLAQETEALEILQARRATSCSHTLAKNA